MTRPLIMRVDPLHHVDIVIEPVQMIAFYDGQPGMPIYGHAEQSNTVVGVIRTVVLDQSAWWAVIDWLDGYRPDDPGETGEEPIYELAQFGSQPSVMSLTRCWMAPKAAKPGFGDLLADGWPTDDSGGRTTHDQSMHAIHDDDMATTSRSAGFEHLRHQALFALHTARAELEAHGVPGDDDPDGWDRVWAMVRLERELATFLDRTER